MRILPLALWLAALVPAEAASPAGNEKIRFLIVDSYHREYMWSQQTHAGLAAALLKLGYLDNKAQADALVRTDKVESSKAMFLTLWMDTKRKNAPAEIAKSAEDVLAATKEFKPALIFLGDDNATNHIGNAYLDSPTPVVFWGVNGTPMKYGLLDSVEKPGHNVTGVYEASYIAEAMALLKKIVPKARTFAILSDDTETGRAKVKKIEELARAGALPMELTETVVTNDYALWKSKALALAAKTDAFFMLNHNSLEDAQGRHVEEFEAGAWYLTHIKKPEATDIGARVQEGMLCTADDSAFKQGEEAGAIAHRILAGKENPAAIASHAPPRGPLMVNRRRAAMLKLNVENKELGVEQYVDKALALGGKGAR